MWASSAARAAAMAAARSVLGAWSRLNLYSLHTGTTSANHPCLQLHTSTAPAMQKSGCAGSASMQLPEGKAAHSWTDRAGQGTSAWYTC